MNKADSGYKHILKAHNDIFTVPEAMDKMYKEYEELGYKMKTKLSGSFSYYLEDGSVIMVYWEKGVIYEAAAVMRRQEARQNKNHFHPKSYVPVSSLAHSLICAEDVRRNGVEADECIEEQEEI